MIVHRVGVLSHLAPNSDFSGSYIQYQGCMLYSPTVESQTAKIQIIPFLLNINRILCLRSQVDQIPPGHAVHTCSV